jgi:hypothetical protein
MAPLAPARFSMMMGWPSNSVSLGTRMRATVSAAPPAAKGAISLMGLDG